MPQGCPPGQANSCENCSNKECLNVLIKNRLCLVCRNKIPAGEKDTVCNLCKSLREPETKKIEMKETSWEFFKKLISIPSPSGFEEKAALLWREYLGNIPVKTDFYGNTFAGNFSLSRVASPKIMVCAHIDEIGLMVNYINDEGFIYISTIGGLDPQILLSQKVTIHSTQDVLGVIGYKPIHLKDEDDEEIKLHHLFVDIGAKDNEEAQQLVSIGDPITINSHLEMLGSSCITSRALDDKMGVFCIAEILKELEDNCSAQVFGVATVQEEVGIYGASMSTYSVKPDIAIAIDVIHCTDVPNIAKEKWGDIKLGNGPVISIGSVNHKEINASIRKTAEEFNIPLQVSASPNFTGTDADAIFTKRGGIPTIIISVPNRYMHSSVEVVNLDDIQNTIKLIVEWCKSANMIGL